MQFIFFNKLWAAFERSFTVTTIEFTDGAGPSQVRSAKMILLVFFDNDFTI
jgi:hypothetical protein